MIPIEDQTEIICKEAVLQNGDSYKYVAQKYKNWKLWLVSKNKFFSFLL